MPVIAPALAVRCTTSAVDGRSASSGVHAAGVDGRQQACQQGHAHTQYHRHHNQSRLNDRRAHIHVQELAHHRSHHLQNARPHQIAQRDADRCPHHALNKSFGHDQADDGAPACAQRAQHADVVAAFRHDRAEGVEDDEAAHDERQEAEQVEHHLPGLDACQDFRAAR